MAEQCQPLLERQQLELRLSLSGSDIWLEQANLHYLQRALLNVLHNGCRFANHVVQLAIELHHDEAWILISDDGPGIASADAERIFQPFVRLDQSSDTTATTQFGLGLAIVERIVSWHHGAVRVKTATTGGACFIFRLPLAGTLNK